MFISVLPGEQVEVALAEEGQIKEYYVEMLHQEKTRGNIYKGYIHNIDAALQAAFINYGANKNGFLQIDEVHPEYYLNESPRRQGKYPLIQNVLKPGQEVLVQVVKEPTGKKGAFLSSYLSLPGRCLVLTPGREQLGVSRKLEDEKERERLKGVIDQLKTGPGIGVIVRTASRGQSKTALTNDFKYLMRLWNDIRSKGQALKPPALIYKELGLATRSVRDYLSADVNEIWVDHKETADQVNRFAKLAFPRRTNLVKLHSDTEKNLWDRFNLNKQIEQIYSREVSLPSGGRLVFDQTEALLAVDINSGKIGGEKNFKEMAYRTNLEAAEEIARQLRLRDIGGQVVIDFIEMKDKKHIREVEKKMRSELKLGRARTDCGRLSRFGLLELVRQRLGSSALSISTEPCPVCKGMGIRRNMEWQSLQALKEIYRLLRHNHSTEPLEYPLHEELALYLLNNKRERLATMEKEFSRKIALNIKHE